MYVLLDVKLVERGGRCPLFLFKMDLKLVDLVVSRELTMFDAIITVILYALLFVAIVAQLIVVIFIAGFPAWAPFLMGWSMERERR